MLRDVTEFVSLARAGAYTAGDRRVSPKERSRWRFTFQRLAKDALTTLSSEVQTGAAAVEQLVDLACETKSHDLFHTEDPMEAANFAVPDAVATLWRALRDHHGFTGFARLAAPQLIRWEQEYGWTAPERILAYAKRSDRSAAATAGSSSRTCANPMRFHRQRHPC